MKVLIALFFVSGRDEANSSGWGDWTRKSHHEFNELFVTAPFWSRSAPENWCHSTLITLKCTSVDGKWKLMDSRDATRRLMQGFLFSSLGITELRSIELFSPLEHVNADWASDGIVRGWKSSNLIWNSNELWLSVPFLIFGSLSDFMNDFK